MHLLHVDLPNASNAWQKKCVHFVSVGWRYRSTPAPLFLHSIPYFWRQQAGSGSRSDQSECFKGMVLAAPIVFITLINNQLLWFFTSLNAAEVTASTLHNFQLSPSLAYVLITICILRFQPKKSMSTLLTPSCNATICKGHWFLHINIPHMLQRKTEADIRRSD